jgi:hypothetical protein
MGSVGRLEGNDSLSASIESKHLKTYEVHPNI